MIIVYKTLLSVLLVLSLFACDSGGSLPITEVVLEDRNGELLLMEDPDALRIIHEVWKEINWDPNVKAEMSREPDKMLSIHLEKLTILYRIWRNSDDSFTIISNNSTEGYGKLEGKAAETLLGILYDT
ncbi:hypothetical protein [Mangrovibacillus cuniculi]|uniref:Uncharacterized protein n=1 Tax=Mangrovibacillus cuniculi TaxID=2593652 RepID=A0A7S8HEN0_9BACI|nr:hypothetical protein [Mangrovibacillus cuniculi]QPC45908.1 hypothetical protein G8O30_02520 [Mangrovibacillus cuniculi]